MARVELSAASSEDLERLIRTHSQISAPATARLASAAAATAASQVNPRATAHSTSAAIRPSHAAAARIAPSAPQASINASVRPARRASRVNRSRTFDSMPRAEANAPVSSSTMPLALIAAPLATLAREPADEVTGSQRHSERLQRTRGRRRSIGNLVHRAVRAGRRFVQHSHGASPG